MNRTQIIGNLGQDAEVKAFEGGQSAISFSVAVTEKWNDASGVKQERTDWFRCTLWRKPEQTSIANYLKKGTKVLVEGKVSARAWVNATTSELNSALEIRVANVELLGGLPAEQNGAPTQQAAPAQTYAQASQPATLAQNIAQPVVPAGAPMPQIGDDDLPF